MSDIARINPADLTEAVTEWEAATSELATLDRPVATDLTANPDEFRAILQQRRTDYLAVKARVNAAVEKVKAAQAVVEQQRRDMEAVLHPLMQQVAMLEEGLWTAGLYLGNDEQFEIIRDGQPAPADTPRASAFPRDWDRRIIQPGPVVTHHDPVRRHHHPHHHHSLKEPRTVTATGPSTEPKPAPKTMPPAEFRRLGYLLELNRTVLHPLGLAMAINDDDGTITILDDRDDLEGWRYNLSGQDTDVDLKRDYIQWQHQLRADRRVEALGYWVQPWDDITRPRFTASTPVATNDAPTDQFAYPAHSFVEGDFIENLYDDTNPTRHGTVVQVLDPDTFTARRVN